MKTLLLLMAKYEQPTVPLLDICEEYFGIKDENTARKQAAQSKLPVPAFRLGGQRSEYMVHLEDLAEYIDRTAAEQRKVWQQMNAA